jgi:hypothetical protein
MYLKIAFGVILSFGLSIFPVLFYAYVNMEDHPPLSETIAVCAFSAILFVFLSSLFTYGARKKAALTALIICGLLILQGLIMALTATDVHADSIVGLGLVFGAAATGLLISYTIFKNRDGMLLTQLNTT